MEGGFLELGFDYAKCKYELLIDHFNLAFHTKSDLTCWPAVGGEELLTHFLQKALLKCGFPRGCPPVASIRVECSSANRCVDSRAIGSLPVGREGARA